MALSLKKKLFLSFGVLALVILGIGSLTYMGIDRMTESNRWVDHTIDVINHFQDLQYELKNTQSAYRAYMLSRDTAFLKTARSSMALLLPNALETQKMTADNPVQQDDFAKLIPVLESKVKGQTLLLSNDPARFKKALILLKDPANIKVNRDLDMLISQMIVEEQNLLSKRRDQETQEAHVTLVILLAGALSATLFAFGALLFIRREIVKREKVQENLQLNEYRLFQFLEAVPLGIFVLDKEGKPFYANQKARELLGRGIIQTSKSENMSILLGAYMAGTDTPYPSEKLAINRALKGEKSTIEDVEVHRPDGQIIPLQVWGTPVYGINKEVQYALAIFSDITERRHVEEMKKSLISVVSHQLKTPVGEINGYVENLLEGLAGELTPKQSEYLMDMREIGMNNYRLISDLLSISKIERGLTTAILDKMPLMEVVQLSLRDYENIMARKGLTLKLEGFEGTLEVMVDRDKLVETLRNLINNAIKFTDKGGLTFRVEVKDRVVLLHVKDTGKGISDTAMAQLFTQKRILGEEAGRAGAGLGLYVA
jgi:PAS domain S-box-containing protein